MVVNSLDLSLMERTREVFYYIGINKKNWAIYIFLREKINKIVKKYYNF